MITIGSRVRLKKLKRGSDSLFYEIIAQSGEIGIVEHIGFSFKYGEWYGCGVKFLEGNFSFSNISDGPLSEWLEEY